MPYFKDLEPCTAFPGVWNNLRAVGWLAKGHDFTRGPVEARPEVEILEGLEPIRRRPGMYIGSTSGCRAVHSSVRRVCRAGCDTSLPKS